MKLIATTQRVVNCVVTVSSGKELLSVGDRLIAYGVGQELFHPVTKESLAGLDETIVYLYAQGQSTRAKEEVMIGEVVIDQVAEQLSYGTITLKQEHENSLDSFELKSLRYVPWKERKPVAGGLRSVYRRRDWK